MGESLLGRLILTNQITFSQIAQSVGIWKRLKQKNMIKFLNCLLNWSRSKISEFLNQPNDMPCSMQTKTVKPNQQKT